MSPRPIVVLGAGVIGLDTALHLAERGYGSEVLVLAEHLPGDTSINYTSPWAGANFSAVSGSDPNALRWDKSGYAQLSEMGARFGAASMIRETPSFEYWDEEPSADKIDSMEGYLKDFRRLSETERPQGTEAGVCFTTVTINAPQHIRWLRERLEAEYGVAFRQQRLSHVQELLDLPGVAIVFNCIGNAAKTLPGIQDERCFPTRGQILLAKAPHIQHNVMRHGRDYETYIIPRPNSNGNVILGGFMQKGNGSSDTHGRETESIVERTYELLPALRSPETEVLAAFSGLRPSRVGGARVEREERMASGGRTVVVVHNYGAGGTGFQAGLGMAADAVGLILEDLRQLSVRAAAKL